MGLNNKYNGCNMKYTYNDAKRPMMPSKFVQSSTLVPNELWGYQVPNDANILPGFNVPMCMGNILPLHTYFTQNIDANAGASWSTTLIDDLTTFIWKGVGPPITYEYRPEICVVKPMMTYPPYRDGAYILPGGGKFFGCQTVKYVADINGVATIEDAPSQDDYETGKAVQYNSFIEQSGIRQEVLVTVKVCLWRQLCMLDVYLWTLHSLLQRMILLSQ